MSDFKYAIMITILGIIFLFCILGSSRDISVKSDTIPMDRDMIAEIADSVFHHNLKTMIASNSLQNMRYDLDDLKYKIDDMGKLWCTVYEFMVEESSSKHLEGMYTDNITTSDLQQGSPTTEMILAKAGIKENQLDSLYKNINWTLE